MHTQESLIHLTYQASAAIWVFVAITTVIFFMRTYSRLFLSKDPINWDDFIISLSWPLMVVLAVSYQIALSTARKSTASELPGTYPTPVFWALFTDAWAFLSICIPKLGVALLLSRMLRPKRWLKITMITYCIVLVILAIVGFIITFTQCDPVAGQWNPWKYPEVKCWSRNIQLEYAITVSAMSALTDLAFSIYPGVVIWNLNMATWKRVNAVALMSLGFISFAFAIRKLYSNTTLLGNPDIITLLFDAIQIGIWNNIENAFVLSAACLPAVPPVFRVFRNAVKTHVSSLSGSHKEETETAGTELTSNSRRITLKEEFKVSSERQVSRERRPAEFV
ncbi:hypothetical protein N7478_010262 [Penicillium angulare]|uniref:uncharacterized protein n=1 Tax=Penicillium angulare TaxID=116970 RepID=UPI00254239F6|nr:uncharacterized protein N7478_010262 [Penicillium angulare]KAJ5267454.1 hypothetical protein N7478_010262 [Penicillium angulare]